MRLVAITTEDNVILSFTGEGGPRSVALAHSVAKNMTVPEAIEFLVSRLGGPKVPESVEDLGKLTPREYLKDVGAL